MPRADHLRGKKMRASRSPNRSEALEAFDTLKKKSLRRTKLSELITKLTDVLAQATEIDRADATKRVVELVDHWRRNDAALRLIELDHVIGPRAFSRRGCEARWSLLLSPLFPNAAGARLPTAIAAKIFRVAILKKEMGLAVAFLVQIMTQ